MNPLTIGAVIVVLALIVYFIWFMPAVKTSDVVIVGGSQRGDSQVSLPLALPLSFNQTEGIVYSYSGWLLVRDFTIGYGNRRTILSKDDSPGLYIDSTSNSLVVAIKTYGTTETILIPDMPAQKWIHFAIVVNQQAVDIYINGMLRQHHTLGQLPDQNEKPIVMGPGWDGVLGRVTYYARSLTSEEVKKQASEAPPSDLYTKPSSPQYFDISWYIGRLNSV